MYKFVQSTLITIIASIMSLSVALADDMSDRLKTAKEIIDVTVTVGVVKQMTDATWPAVLSDIKTKIPEVNADAIKELKAEYVILQQQMIGTVMEGMDQIYADEFTLEELKVLLEFHLSPTGKKVLIVQPKIMAQIMPKLMQAMRTSAPIITQKFQEIIKKHGLKTKDL